MAALAERHKFHDCRSKNVTSGFLPLENALGMLTVDQYSILVCITMYITAYWIEELIDNLII